MIVFTILLYFFVRGPQQREGGRGGGVRKNMHERLIGQEMDDGTNKTADALFACITKHGVEGHKTRSRRSRIQNR